MTLLSASPGGGWLEPRYSKKCDDWTYSDASAHYPTTAGTDEAPPRRAATFKRRVGALFFSPRRRALPSGSKVGSAVKPQSLDLRQRDRSASTSRQLSGGGSGDGAAHCRAQFNHRAVEEAERRHQILIRDQLLFHLNYVEQLASQLDSAAFGRECVARLRAASNTIRQFHEDDDFSNVNDTIERQRRFSGDLKSRTSATVSLTQSVPLTAERVVAAAGAGGGSRGSSGATPAGTTCSDGAWMTRATAGAIGARRRPLPLKSASEANIKAQAAAIGDWLPRQRRSSRRRPSQHASIARLAEALNAPVAVGALVHPILKSDDSQYATALGASCDDVSLIGYENAPTTPRRLAAQPEGAWRHLATASVSLRMLQVFRNAAAAAANAPVAQPSPGQIGSAASLAAGNYAVPGDCFEDSVDVSSALSSPSLSPTRKRQTPVQLLAGDSSHGSEPIAVPVNRQSTNSDENKASGSKSPIAPIHFMNAIMSPMEGAPPPSGLVKPVTPPPFAASSDEALTAADRKRRFRRTLCETLRQNVSGSFTKYDGDRATHDYPHVLSLDDGEDCNDGTFEIRVGTAPGRPTRLVNENGGRQRVLSERIPLVQHLLHHRHLEPTSPASDERHRQHFHNEDRSPRRNQLRQRHYQQQRGVVAADATVSPRATTVKLASSVTVPAAAYVPNTVMPSPLPANQLTAKTNIYDNDNYDLTVKKENSSDAFVKRESPTSRRNDDSYDYVDSVGADAGQSAAEPPPCLFPSSISTLAVGIGATGMTPIVNAQYTRADSVSVMPSISRGVIQLTPTAEAIYGNVMTSPTTTVSSQTTVETSIRPPGPRPKSTSTAAFVLNSSASLPVASILEAAAYCNYRPGDGEIDEEDDYDFYEELSDGNSDKYDDMMSLSSSLVSVRSELNPRIVFQRGGRGRASGHSIKSQHRKQQQQRRQRQQQQQQHQNFAQKQQVQQNEQNSEPSTVPFGAQQQAQQSLSGSANYCNTNQPIVFNRRKDSNFNDLSRGIPRAASADTLMQDDGVPCRKSTHSASDLRDEAAASGSDVPQSMYRTAVNLADDVDNGSKWEGDSKINGKTDIETDDDRKTNEDILNNNKMDNETMNNNVVEVDSQLAFSCVADDGNVAPPLPPKPAQFSPHCNRDERTRRAASNEKLRDDINSASTVTSQPLKHTVTGGPSLFVDIYDDYADIVIGQAPKPVPSTRVKPIPSTAEAVIVPPRSIYDDEPIDYVSICPSSTMALGKLSRHRKRFSALLKKSNSISGLNQPWDSQCYRQNLTSAALATSPGANSAASGEYFQLDSASLSSGKVLPPTATVPIWCAAPFFGESRVGRAAAFANGRQNSTPHWVEALPPVIAQSSFKRVGRPLNKKKASSSLFLFRH